MVLVTNGLAIDGAAARSVLRQAVNSPTPLSLLAIGVGDGPFHELGRLTVEVPDIMNAGGHKLPYPNKRVSVLSCDSGLKPNCAQSTSRQ